MTATDLEQNAAPPADAPTDEAALEAFARRLGWRPEAEWANAPANRRPKIFLTPSQYIDKVDV